MSIEGKMKEEVPKWQRLQEFYRRLGLLPRASSFEEARQQIDNTLNAVEDEMTSVPFDPQAWESDGRMYPVQDDNIRSVPEHPSIKRLRSSGHFIFIRTNGAMEIRRAGSSDVLFSKPGSDGKEVWQT